MSTAPLEPGFQSPPVDAARVFRAALDAMARPGRVHRVTGALPPAPLSPAAGALALTLLDPDTPVWLAPSLDRRAVRNWLRFHTGAPISGRPDAAFALTTWGEARPLTDFAAGDPEFPDRSCTLIVEVAGLGRTHRLTGPGIETEAWLETPDPAFHRANAARFPLGVDLFLTCADALAALPRTTRVEG